MVQSIEKTILDVLVEKNRLSPTNASSFGKALNNQEIERILREMNLVTSEDIAKAYAVIYDLPYTKLEHYKVAQEIFSFIPRDMCERYEFVAFDKTMTGKYKIALGNPSLAKGVALPILEEIKKKTAVDFYITTPESIKSVLQSMPLKEKELNLAENANLDDTSNDLNIVNPKSIDLKNMVIPYEVISKFPQEVSRKYNMVVFENPNPTLIKVALSDPGNKKLREVLNFVSQKNNIAVEEFFASPEDVKEAIEKYYVVPPLVPPIKQPRVVEEPVEEKNIEDEKPVKSENPSPNEKKPTEDEILKEESVLSDAKVALKSDEDTENLPTEEDSAPVEEKPKFVRKPDEIADKDEPVGDSSTDISIGLAGFSGAVEADLDKYLGEVVNTIELAQQIINSGSVPKILAGVIALAVSKKASDIHIEPEEENVRIRFRIDGILKNVLEAPAPMIPALISRIKILSKLKIDEQRVPQDGRFNVVTQGHEIDLRVSILPTVRGEKAALRILDKTQGIYKLKELGFTDRNLKILEENIVKPFGTILVTGPTGSGKSTTLYSILNQISTPKVNVITLEDPVEYEMPGINQCQVRPKIGFSFADGLRSILRQDPNIIMVGEIRDAETAGLVTHAALTGHLVLTSLHTNDAAGALPRLTNMGIEPFLITSAINVIVGQRLVRKLCPKCKKETELPSEVMGNVEKELMNMKIEKPYKFYEGTGCSECTDGYSGRIGIYEVLEMTEKIEDAAIKRQPTSTIQEIAISEGMTTMKQDGLKKALAGITTVSEILRVTMTD